MTRMATMAVMIGGWLLAAVMAEGVAIASAQPVAARDAGRVAARGNLDNPLHPNAGDDGGMALRPWALMGVGLFHAPANPAPLVPAWGIEAGIEFGFPTFVLDAPLVPVLTLAPFFGYTAFPNPGASPAAWVGGTNALLGIGVRNMLGAFQCGAMVRTEFATHALQFAGHLPAIGGDGQFAVSVGIFARQIFKMAYDVLLPAGIFVFADLNARAGRDIFIGVDVGGLLIGLLALLLAPNV